jgi:DNA-binding HxlR family transcriptional regulator
LPLITRKWPLPILDAVADGPARFGEISARLSRITDRALAMGLKQLDGATLVTRRIEREYPPIARYAPTSRASGLLAPLADIAH